MESYNVALNGAYNRFSAYLNDLGYSSLGALVSLVGSEFFVYHGNGITVYGIAYRVLGDKYITLSAFYLNESEAALSLGKNTYGVIALFIAGRGAL